MSHVSGFSAGSWRGTKMDHSTELMWVRQVSWRGSAVWPNHGPWQHWPLKEWKWRTPSLIGDMTHVPIPQSGSSRQWWPHVIWNVCHRYCFSNPFYPSLLSLPSIWERLYVCFLPFWVWKMYVLLLLNCQFFSNRTSTPLKIYQLYTGHRLLHFLHPLSPQSFVYCASRLFCSSSFSCYCSSLWICSLLGF